jgi:hypothetical protein
MTKDERLSTAEARLEAAMKSKDAAVITLKDVLLDVMVRDGSADWARIEAQLVEALEGSEGLTRLRLTAAIDHLRELQAKRG